MIDQFLTRGSFPFGQPNDVRPMRLPDVGRPDALVVGVYPSAFHVSWRARGTRIASLAVDVEPVVFWNGVDPDPERLLAEWRRMVGFHDGLGTVTAGHNGPSGDTLEEEILTPLGLDSGSVAFTDAVPWFFVKDGRGSQAAAIRERLAPFAQTVGLHAGSLPPRPTPRQLVEIVATTERRESLTSEVQRAAAPLLITLGDEALQAVLAMADACEGVQRSIAADGYGAAGQVSIGGRTMQFRPLAHPGLLRQQIRQPGRAATKWQIAHHLWKESLGS